MKCTILYKFYAFSLIIVLLSFFYCTTYSINFDKAGVRQLAFINKNSYANNEEFDIIIRFNLFDSRTCATFIQTHTFLLPTNAEYYFDITSFQDNFDASINEDKFTIDEDIKQLKKIFGCISSVKAINKRTQCEAKLYIYGARDGSLKIFVLNANEQSYDYFHLDFDAALNSTSEYYKDCMNGNEKLYPNGFSSKLYTLALDKGVSAADFINRMRSIYENYFSSEPHLINDLKSVSLHRIKKFLFQIWIGSNPLPKEYKQNQAKWLKILSPEWTYKLYTDADVIDLEFSSAQSKATYDALSNKTAQADLLRMEILLKQGGVYVDLDTEPFEPIDFLVENFDFFGMLYGPTLGSLFIDNYFIGSMPAHPIIEQAIKNIIALSSKLSQFHPNLLTSIVPLTRSVYQHLGNYQTRDIIFPVKYFNNYSTGIFSYGTHYPKRLWKK